MKFVRMLALARKTSAAILILCLLTISTAYLLLVHAPIPQSHITGHSEPTNWPMVLLVLATACIVFGLPAACLVLKGKWQTRIHFFAALPAGCLAFFWFALATMGGGGFATYLGSGMLLAVLCWTCLFVLSCYALFRRWRMKRRLRTEQ